MSLAPNISWVLFVFLLLANVLSPKAFSMMEEGSEAGTVQIETESEEAGFERDSKFRGTMSAWAYKKRNRRFEQNRGTNTKKERDERRAKRRKNKSKTPSVTPPSVFNDIKVSVLKTDESDSSKVCQSDEQVGVRNTSGQEPVAPSNLMIGRPVENTP